MTVPTSGRELDPEAREDSAAFAEKGRPHRWGAAARRVTMRIPPRLYDRLESEAQRMGMPLTDIALARLLPVATPTFPIGLAPVVADALQGSVADPAGYSSAGAASVLWMAARDAFAYERLAEKYGTLRSEDARLIIERLRGLTPEESLALLAAVRRYFWLLDQAPDLEVETAALFAGLAESHDPFEREVERMVLGY